MPLQPLIQVEHLTKSVGDKMLFQDISFSLAEGQRMALIARNGVGKSTLLNILTQQTDYDSGRITYRRDLRWGYLQQKPHFEAGLSVWDVMRGAIRKTTLDEDTLALEVRAKQILSRLRLNDLSQDITTLSGGQQKRVALAIELLTEPELLILDEPTNHLDLGMVEWLEEYLNKSSHTLLMVTHDRYFLDNVCSDIIELDNHTLYSYHGNYSYFLQKRAERIEVENAETERYRNLYRTELEWIRRMPQARGHKAQYRVDRFEEIETKAKRQILNDQISLDLKATYIGSKIFSAKHVYKSFPATDGSDIVILSDFSYIFSRYEKLGVIGDNGTGKSTFIHLLLGLEKPDMGHFDIGTTIRFGYFSQNGIVTETGKKVIDVIRDKAEYIDLGGGKRLSASQFLQHFLFSPQQQYDYVDKLSGGERQRLHLCSVLMQNPNFLILDEPTNDLDIQTLNVLEEYLRQFKGCLIVVSHDRYFMDKVVDHLFVFHGSGNIEDFPGNYTNYRRTTVGRPSSHQPQTTAAKKTPPDEKQAPQKPRLNEQPRRLTYKQQQELTQIEQRIQTLDTEKQSLEQQMSNPQDQTHDEIQRLAQQYQSVITELEEKEMRWLELSELMN